MSIKPTDEQAHTLALFETGQNLTIEARAGCGKTSTLKLLAAAASSKRMLYTSFAASVVRDAKASFPRHVRASTNHGLAWGTVGKHYADTGRLPPEARLSPRVLQQHFNWSPAAFGGLDVDEGCRAVMETLTRFCQSADPEMTDWHVPQPETIGTKGAIALAAASQYILAAAHRVWAEWENPSSKLPVTHDTYLKRWALGNPRLPYDCCLLDEAQDTNPLMIGLLLQQTHAQRIIVGDQFQQIYSWRGAVNAMTQFESDAVARLTQSFRFGNAVADAANAVLKGHLNTDARVRGLPSHASRLATIDNARVVLARKNATLIAELVTAAREKPEGRVAVVGGVDDLIRLVDGAGALQRRERPTRCPELNEFSEWDEVREYSKKTVGKDLQVLVRLVEEFGVPSLLHHLERVRGNERDESTASLILSTGHKAKGREWPQVRLCDDFKAPAPDDATETQRREAQWNPEEANLLYVAVTRARDVLDVTNCSAWQDARLRSGYCVDPPAPSEGARTHLPSALTEGAGHAVGDWLNHHPNASLEDAYVALINDAYAEAQPARHAQAGLR